MPEPNILMQPFRRLWEVDSARGIAILLMLVSNFSTDLFFLGGGSPQPGVWFYFARIVLSMFIFLAGVSLSLSHARVRENPRKGKKFLLRGAKIFCCGLLITAASFLLSREWTVWFGVLHLIGLSVVLSYPFLERKFAALFTGILVLFIGGILQTIAADVPLLLWAGVMPFFFISFDYTPVFPWFGIFLLGIFSGSVLFPQGKRRFPIKELSQNRFFRWLCLLGRNSLFIYFIHQPVFFGLLWVFQKGIW